MQIIISKDSNEMGAAAAEKIASLLAATIANRGEANLLLSTGASQFTTLSALAQKELDWNRVTMFHLDEYVGLPQSHTASFRRYLKERFVMLVPLKKAVFINGEGDVGENLRQLSMEIQANAIDVGVIGIGENAHIAFNDPPADFTTDAAYHIVQLNAACKRQQVGEGWFTSVAEVPDSAISITPRQIMKCRHLVAPVPGQRKARAIYDMLSSTRTDPNIPATLLREHEDCDLFLDMESASQCNTHWLAKNYTITIA